MRPSVASLELFLAASACPLSLSTRRAPSMSPPDSSRARFTSIIPAAVSSRSCLIFSIVLAKVPTSPRSLRSPRPPAHPPRARPLPARQQPPAHRLQGPRVPDPQVPDPRALELRVPEAHHPQTRAPEPRGPALRRLPPPPPHCGLPRRRGPLAAPPRRVR